jgi:hypothetical protein
LIEPPTPTAPIVRPTAVRPALAATQTAQANSYPYVIERVALTTRVGDDGEPVVETNVVSTEVRNLYLAVQLTNAEPGTELRAYWFEGGRIIGQSDVTLPERDSASQWAVLPLRVESSLQPGLPHAVELRIDGRLVNSYAFRVGTGDLPDIIADFMVALGTDEEGEPVNRNTVFDVFAPQIVAVVRVSSKVDPTGLLFTAFWYYGDSLVAQTGPDGGQPQLPENPQPRDRQMTFTWLPQAPVSAGEYTVSLMVNGIEVDQVEFELASEQLPTPTPQPSPTPTPTPRPPSARADVLDLQVASDLSTNGAPEGGPLREWDAAPNQTVGLFVAVRFSNLRVDDVVEVDIVRDGRAYDRLEFPVAALDQGWLSIPVELRSPESGEDTYEFIVYINGERERDTELVVSAGQPPAPTSTPD